MKLTEQKLREIIQDEIKSLNEGMKPDWKAVKDSKHKKAIKKLASKLEDELAYHEHLEDLNLDTSDFEEMIVQYYVDNVDTDDKDSFEEMMSWFDGSDDHQITIDYMNS
jgi:hypothetical protein